jgi:hypothetical protein
MYHPSDSMNWGIVSTEGATSHLHEDDEGFGTSTQPITGAKYWVIFDRDRSLKAGKTRGDLGSISFAPPLSMFQDHAVKGWMTAEAVLLRPGDLL